VVEGLWTVSVQRLRIAWLRRIRKINNQVAYQWRTSKLQKPRSQASICTLNCATTGAATTRPPRWWTAEIARKR
jgi:hypothetical protein